EAYRIAQEVRIGAFMTKPMPGDQLPADFLDTLGLIYEKLGKTEQTAERIALFEAARRRYAHDARVFLHLGQAYVAAKEVRRAQQAYDTARGLLEKSANLPLERRRSLQLEIEQAQ